LISIDLVKAAWNRGFRNHVAEKERAAAEIRWRQRINVES